MAKVLLVDDERGVRDVLRRVLETMGCTILEACDGNQALNLFRRERPDLVIIDIIMPDRDGIETIAAMKDSDPTVRILAISGGGRAQALDLLAVAPRAGADAMLAKPFRRSELLAMVQDLLGKPLAERPV